MASRLLGVRLLGVAFVVAGLALSACKKSKDAGSTKPPPPPVKVETITAELGPAPEQIVLTGMIAADQRSELTADIAGKVIAVYVERGERVKMGAQLAKLDVRNAALSAREAHANLESARAQRRLAEEECKRAQALLDKGAITRSEYDRQITQCTSALQQVSAAEARTEMIAKSIADGIVRAPFEGRIADKTVSPGEWVAPGRPLFTLVDDDPLEIELSVPEVAVRAVEVGQEVELTAVAFPDQRFTAKVSRIGAEIGRTRSLIVEATIDNNDHLVPGMFAEARVTIGRKPRVVLPETAVIGPCKRDAEAELAGSGSASQEKERCRPGKTWHAFVIVEGEAQDRPVQLGASPGPGKVSILQGVKSGDKVVANITEQVVDGLRVVE